MSSFNKIVIVGYLGRDPELRHTPNGDAVCSFSMATTETRKDEEFTTWFNVSVWGKSAEACNTYLSKGSQVYVEGRLSQRNYEKKDGTPGVSLDVRASDVQFLGKAGDNAKSASAGGETAQIRKAAGLLETDDEIPF